MFYDLTFYSLSWILVTGYHRRKIYTETKANSRCFCLGGKIVCCTGNLMSECAVLCTQLLYCTFPFTFVGGRGREDVLCRFVFQV